MQNSNHSFRDLKVYKKAFELAMENSETQSWLDFSLAYNYIIDDKHKVLLAKSEEDGRMLSHMDENPEKYLRLKEKLEVH